MNNNELLKVHGCANCNNKLCVEKVEIFKNLSQLDLLDVLKIIKHKEFNKGETIFDVGDNFNTLYVVNSGSIKIHNYSYNGDENILYFLKEGDILGEISLLKTSKFSNRATAMEKTNLCLINKVDFDHLIHQKPSLSLKILESAYSRIKNLEKHLQILQSSNSLSKISGFILMHYKENNKNKVKINMTQQEIANYIGIRRETYSRNLNNLINDKIIKKINGGIEIINFDRLSELSTVIDSYFNIQ